jgi:hypothetical protein
MIEKTYLYPADLLQPCKAAWEKMQNARSGAANPRSPWNRSDPPFPSDEHLLELLETIYHASFLVDEGRRIGLRVMYVLPETFENQKGLNLGKSPARFARHIDLSVGALLKLAPAVRASESAIALAPIATLRSDTSNGLAFWGVLQLGNDWSNLLAAAESAAMCPPNCLTVSSFASGALTASALGTALIRLRNGQLIGTPLPGLDQGPVGRFFDSAAKQLYLESTKRLCRTPYSSERDEDQHPFHL